MKTNDEWTTIAKMQLKEIGVADFSDLKIAVVAQCLKNYSEQTNQMLINENQKQHDQLIERDGIIQKLGNALRFFTSNEHIEQDVYLAYVERVKKDFNL